ncbi:hypothetical protein T11_3549 [Trichinella zimbabwensis]|uniref:Uncharacterized protein n=1 Tax=Trichinella zimbabwensis TaxID=268475 RepID=A0A0V1GQN5_9BILA|nr:hypothetical protein T11_3549 [Trichinella zimbabwensis]
MVWSSFPAMSDRLLGLYHTQISKSVNALHWKAIVHVMQALSSMVGFTSSLWSTNHCCHTLVTMRPNVYERLCGSDGYRYHMIIYQGKECQASKMPLNT